MISQEERPIRLRPRRPRRTPDESRTWSKSFQRIMHLARMTTKPSGHASSGGGPAIRTKPHYQRCAVRVSYSPNRVRGQWAAHGRYIARESARQGADGFDANGDITDIPQRLLAQWQRAGDQRLFKIIISPENGKEIDLPRLTRDLMDRMSLDLARDLEWVAVAHHNTDHPHVHVALRGRDLRLASAFVRHGLRHEAGRLCSEQIGLDVGTGQDGLPLIGQMPHRTGRPFKRMPSLGR